LSIGLVTGPAEAQLIACEQVEARWRNATAATSLAEWVAIYDEAHNESDCGGDVVEQIGLDIIAKELEAIERTYASSDGDATLRGLLGRLDILQGFGSHWGASFLRGDMYRKLRDPARALQAYRDALGLVDDEELTATAPPFHKIALLRDRLDETAVIVAQLEPAAIKLPVTRSGELISQYSFTTRGYTRKKTLVPIQFVYAKDIMTDSGRSSFEDALQTLVKQGSPDIRVAGHTDPVGSAAYNRKLSIDRACAVRRALMAENYRGEVEAVGMGEDRPFKFDDPGLYSEERRHQAHRRVELILRQGAADSQGRSEPCRG
jgi:outer membrane protein OmpA-like peptidoglycan-associated protein